MKRRPTSTLTPKQLRARVAYLRRMMRSALACVEPSPSAMFSEEERRDYAIKIIGEALEKTR